MRPIVVCRLLCHTASLRYWQAYGADLASVHPDAADAYLRPPTYRRMWLELFDAAAAARTHHQQHCPHCQAAPRSCPEDLRIEWLLSVAGQPTCAESRGRVPYRTLWVVRAAQVAQRNGVTGSDRVGVALTLVAGLDPMPDESGPRRATMADIVDAWAVAQLL